MRVRDRLSRFILVAALGVLLLPACGRFIYDEDDGTMGVGNGRFSMVDASKYTSWTYVNLDTRTAVKVDEYVKGNVDAAPDEWHFAMHRFDCKTNGAEVLETTFGSIAALRASGKLPDGGFIADGWTDDRVAIDMSRMLEGIIGYAKSYYNPELSKWMDVDISGMPPVYTPSNKVYLMKFADGRMAALKFTDWVGPMEVKGFNSFDYAYPFEF